MKPIPQTHDLPTPTRPSLPAAALCALVLVCAAAGASAQTATGGHAGHGAASAPTPAAASAEWAEAEVRRIDAANGRVTLRHGPIRSLDMPPMTMVFQARDPAQVSGLQPGDKVRFQAAAEGGKYILTQIEKQP